MRLPSIRDFARDGIDPRRYATLPDDWWLAVADVAGSTGLATAGRHRHVNFVAGAAVAVLSAVLRDGDEPAACQFGGDGAIAAVPPERHAAAAAALASLAHWSITDMDVPLIVGMVSVGELGRHGLEAMAALQDFGNGNVVGQFLGSGVAAAETWVKSGPSRQIAPHPGDLPGLAGLSCRWQPVPARRGVVVCVIVDPTAGGAAGIATLQRLQKDIEGIVPLAAAAPLGQGEPLKPRWPPGLTSLRLELRTEPRPRRLARLVKALAGSALIRLGDALGGRLGPLDVAGYRQSVAMRCDYRKNAGGLRFVLDLTLEEADALEAHLASAGAAGLIRYGLARATATTITCLVGDFAADRHIHFVDGADLGFWRASVQFKHQPGR